MDSPDSCEGEVQGKDKPAISASLGSEDPRGEVLRHNQKGKGRGWAIVGCPNQLSYVQQNTPPWFGRPKGRQPLGLGGGEARAVTIAGFGRPQGLNP